MNYLTNYYKNLSEQLQDRLNFLTTQLNEINSTPQPGNPSSPSSEDENFYGMPRTKTFKKQGVTKSGKVITITGEEFPRGGSIGGNPKNQYWDAHGNVHITWGSGREAPEGFHKRGEGDEDYLEINDADFDPKENTVEYYKRKRKEEAEKSARYGKLMSDAMRKKNRLTGEYEREHNLFAPKGETAKPKPTPLQKIIPKEPTENISRRIPSYIGDRGPIERRPFNKPQPENIPLSPSNKPQPENIPTKKEKVKEKVKENQYNIIRFPNR